jgi:hypothetical protein
MKLGEILRTQGRVAVPHPVSFIAIGEDSNGCQIKADVPAVFLCVSEEKRTQLRLDAAAELEKRSHPPTPAVIADEETYHLLFHALHQKEPTSAGSYGKLFDNLTEVRHSLVFEEARRLHQEYNKFIAAEFPPKISDEEFDKMVDEAKKNSASDLLTSFGFEKCVALLSSLAGRSGR